MIPGHPALQSPPGYDFNLYGQIFYHYFDCPDIQKHKFCNFADDGDTDTSRDNCGSSDISQVFGVYDILTLSDGITGSERRGLGEKNGYHFLCSEFSFLIETLNLNYHGNLSN